MTEELAPETTNEGIKYQIVHIVLSMANAWFLVLIILRLFDPPKHSIYPDRLGRSKIDGMAAIPTVHV